MEFSEPLMEYDHLSMLCWGLPVQHHVQFDVFET